MTRTLTLVPRWAGHSDSDFYHTPVDLARTRAASRRFVVLLSDNDPFTSDFRENGRLWQERLGAEVVLVPGARHFNAAQEPAVLDALRSSFQQPVGP